MLKLTPKFVIPALALAAGAAFAVVTQLTEAPPAARTEAGSPTSLQTVPLLDDHAETVSLAKFKGRWLVLFFGYASCPDVCPTSLAYLAREMRSLGGDAARVQPVFVSIDPQRDTPKTLGAYVHYYDPSFAALTGTPEHLRQLARQVGAYYELTPTGGKQQDGKPSYNVVHSGTFFIISPGGELVQTVSPPQANGALRDALRSVMAAGAH